MESNNKHIKNIKRYLDNAMSEKECYAFERQMEADPFLMDAVEGYQNTGINNVEEILDNLRSQIGTNKKTKIVPMWMRIAAGVVMLIGLGTLVLIDRNNQNSDLVSDQIQISETEENVIPQQKETKVEEIEIEVPQNELASQMISDTEKLDGEIKKEQARKMFKSRQSVAKVSLQEDELQQDVDMALRYEDSAVRAERALVGKIEGVKLKEVTSVIDDKDIEVRMLGKSSFRDTTAMAFRGRVVDEQGIPLPGVVVTNSVAAGDASKAKMIQGVVSDLDGNFEIKAPQSGAVLQLSFIGFKDQLAISKSDSIGDIVMNSEQLALDEVVTVGYGVQKKKAKATNGYASEALNDDSNEIKLLPEPIVGIKKMVRKVERLVHYPNITKKENKLVRTTIYVSAEGVVNNVEIDATHPESLKIQLQQALEKYKWQTPQIKGKSTPGIRNVVFSLTGK